MENSIRILQKTENKLLYDSAIPLLGKYPKELKAGPQRNICISKLKVALFIIAKK